MVGPARSGPDSGPTRSVRTLVSVAAQCTECGFTSTESRGATIHALDTGHEVEDARVYLVSSPYVYES